MAMTLARELRYALAVASSLTPSLALAEGEISGWRHGIPFAYETGLLDEFGFGETRKRLAENGVNIHFSLTGWYQDIVSGGLEEESEASASYDFQLYFDTAKMGLWNGGSAVLRFEGKTDDFGVNPFTGAIIPVNFDAAVPAPGKEDFLTTEFWYGQRFADDKAEVVGGMWDLARFFDVSPFSGPYHYRFANAHMFFNSVLLPYAQYNRLGGVFLYRPNDLLTITTAFADPNSTANDLDWFDEGDYDIFHEWRVFGPVLTKLPTMASAGFVYRDQEMTTLSGGTTDSDWAGYLNFNQWLYQDPNNPHQAVGLFGRYGFSDGKVNIIKNHFSLGITGDGVLIPGRPKDSVGLVGWYNDFSDDLPAVTDESSYGLEAYYRFQATDWLQITADIQYLIDPGITKGNDDTTVLGIRAVVHF